MKNHIHYGPKSLVRGLLQGGFFNFSPLNLAKSQSLYEIPYSNFFSPILLLGLGLRQIQGGEVKKTTL